MNTRAIIVTSLGIAAFTIGVLFLSPSLLLLIELALRIEDWETLSSIGQSYTGVATLFAAFALVGILITFRAQRQQLQLRQLQAARDLQMQVYRMSLEDKLYASAFGVDPNDEEAYRTFRLTIFTNFAFRYLEFSYLAGELSESEVRGILANENFSDGSSALQWWSDKRHRWRPGLEKRRETSFKTLVEEEYRYARERLAEEPDAAG